MSENHEQPNAQPVPDETETAEAASVPEATPAVDPLPDNSATADTGATDEGWVVDSEVLPGEETRHQGQTPSRPAPGRSTNGQKLTRVTLGGTILAMDAVSERLERLDESEVEQRARSRTLDDVLVPMSQWQEQFGVVPDRPTRHLLLGMAVDARSRAGATARFLNGIGNKLAGAINLVLGPVRTQRVFRPVRRNFERAVDRGEGQVARWRTMGRAEEARSRTLAETAFANTAEEAMDELVASDRVEVFIQEIIEAQTVGIVDEIIEEIRERAVSSDNFFERPVRRLLRRPDRSQVPPPDFDPLLVRPIVRRNYPIPEGSLLGHYAGFMSRLLALVVDVGLIVIVLALASSLLTTAIDVLGLQEGFDAFVSSSGILPGLLAVGHGMAVVFGYLVLFWMLTGQTLGMMLLGLRVVSRTGGRVTLGRSLMRIVGYLVLPGIFFLGFLWVLGDDKREAWHDKLARTYVVYVWDARPDETFLTYSMVMDE